MTSERQKAANRANAQRSTGPKTPEGKAVVRLNPMRHGLLAHDVVLPEEDAEAFEDLLSQVRSNLSPVGPLEKFLVDHIVNAMWRLQRLSRVETALFYSRIEGLKADRIEKEVASYESSLLDSITSPCIVTDQAAHREASERLQRAKDERDRDEVLFGRAMDADAKEGDAFAKLARYERSSERSFYRALDELRRTQNERRRGSSPPILTAIASNAEGSE